MKVVDLYTALQAQDDIEVDFFERNAEFRFFADTARNWGLNPKSIRQWMRSAVARGKQGNAFAYLGESRAVVDRVESAFGRELPGVLVLLPSFGDFDGFARYDSGHHQVMLGIDFPDSDVDYLKALTAHELSHVYRDHAPRVWEHLGKPLSEVKRSEYLEAGTAAEHLVSEGLATLFSSALFPEIPPSVHHYYEPDEWEWCEAHPNEIDQALTECLRGDEDVWSFYGEGRVGRGSPSRLQYYWAARKLRELLGDSATNIRALVELHEKPAADFSIFNLKV